MSSNFLFAYGTLQSEFKTDISSKIAKSLVPCGTGYFYGRLFEIEHYPAALLDIKCGYKIYGQLFEVLDQAVWPILDEYEECTESFPLPHEYTRQEIEIINETETKTRAWVYLYNHATEQRFEILSGNYVAYYKDNK